MPRKSMIQGYKTSNGTGTDWKTAGNGGQSPKGSVLSPLFKKEECKILSYKNDDRHPYNKQNADTSKKLNLPELEKSDTETRRTMLNVTRMNKLYYLHNFHDMRCKYEQVLSVIHQKLNREPQENKVLIATFK